MNRVAVICFWWGQWPEDNPGLGKYYIHKLRSMVARNTTVEHDFLVYTDGDKYRNKNLLKDFTVIPITREFEQYKWNLKKLSMFDKSSVLHAYQWVVALDLDMVITANIDFLLTHRSVGLMTCKGAYTDDIGGSIIGFCPRAEWPSYMVDYIRSDPKEIERRTGGSERKFYRLFFNEDILKDMVTYWQDVYPGKVLSYKMDKYQNGASVVRFHGNPRPHEVVDQHGWIRENWI